MTDAAEFFDDVLVSLALCGIPTDDAEELIERHRDELAGRAGDEALLVALELVERSDAALRASERRS